jgi:predicted transcriptional regulator
MSKTVTLRLDEQTYMRFRNQARDDNRTLSNFIATATQRYIEEHGFADEKEMAGIRANRPLNASLKRGLRDAASGKGRFVD